MAADPIPESHHRLDRTMLGGATWMASTKWAGQLFIWTGTVLVARVLSPADYGLLTMANVFLASLAFLSEFGIGVAVVSMRDLSDDKLEQLNGLAVLLGVVGMALSMLVAVPLGYFFRARELPPVVAALGLTCFLGAFQVVPGGLLRRELAFRSLALIDLFRGLCVVTITLVAALSGLRYWALVAGSVAGVILGTAMTLRLRRMAFRWPRVRELTHELRFSRDMLVARLAWIAYSEGDFAVAGRRLGAAAAGTYGLAWTIAKSPFEKISMTLTDITPALFSAVKSDRAMLRRYFCNVTELLALVMIPIAVGLACVSRDLITVLLGPKWHDAALPLALIALYSGLQGVTTLWSPLYTVIGEQQFLARRSVATAVVLVSGFVVGSHWGPAGIAAAWLLLHPMLSIYSYSGVRRSLDLSGLSYLRLLRLGVDGSVAMAAILIIFVGFVAADWPPLLRLSTTIPLGAATFMGVTWWIHGQRIQQIVAWAQRARRGEVAPA